MRTHPQTLAADRSSGPAPRSPGPAVERFGEFTLDRRAEELRHRGRPVALQHQPFKLLSLLVGRPGELVTREEVRRHLWGDDVHVDYEQGIAYCVREVRKALGDDARAPCFVQTVPGRGFRFLMPVRAGRSRGRRFRRGSLAGSIIAVLVLAVVVVVAWWAAGSEPPRLAVLPFESLGGGAEGELHARGLTEELIGWLGRRYGQELQVLAPQSVYRLEGDPRSLRRIARELDLDYILRGTVRRSESGVRVTARLLRPEDPDAFWSTQLDSSLEDPVALQIRLGHELGQALGPALLPEQTRRPSPEVVETLWKVRALLEAGGGPVLAQARELLDEALEKEPLSPHLWVQRGRLAKQLQRVEEAKRAFRRALEIDDHNTGALLELGALRLFVDLDLPAADRLFRRALELNPSRASAHQLQAFLFSALGRHHQALTAIARARSLDPLAETVTADSGWIHYFARRYEVADARCGESLELGLSNRWAHLCRVLARRELGDPERTWEAARAEMEALDFAPGDEPGEGGGGAVPAELDSLPPERALELYWRARLAWLERWQAPWPPPSELATVHMALGESEQALAELERAFEVERGWERLYLPHYPLFDPIRTEPDFQRLLARLATGPDSTAARRAGTRRGQGAGPEAGKR